MELNIASNLISTFLRLEIIWRSQRSYIHDVYFFDANVRLQRPLQKYIAKKAE